MKKFYVILLGLLLSNLLFGKQVDLETAKTTGEHFISTSSSYRQQVSLGLAYQSVSKETNATHTQEPLTYFYVFNFENGDGFVIVSGDDIVKPILGYSSESDFDPNNIPPQVAKWLEGYKDQIRYAIETEMQPTKEIEEAWEALLNNKQPNSYRGFRSVNPLVTTKWSQSPHYNALCPYDYSESERTVTGCVATAMAQIMKYHNYPANGKGIHSYNHSNYGTLTANFGSTTYNWTSMPTKVTSSNSAVATLMYHCGVSVDMNYDVAANGGSGAFVISSRSPKTHCAEYALKTYFSYKSSLSGKERDNYSETQWINLLQNELDNARPILYAGFGSGGGHAFVFDGYDNSDFFHVNWGWGGYYDGYFEVGALNPSGVGTGGGTGGFNSGQQAIIGIEPGTSVPSSKDIELNSSITVSPNPIVFGAPFVVNADVINRGSSNFSGDYGAALFSDSGTFIDWIQTFSTGSNPLPPNYHYTNGLDFKDTIRMVPGDYYIGIYFRPTGDDWILAGEKNYDNYIKVTYTGPSNDIEVYSDISANPTVLEKGKGATISANILNDGNSTFYGKYQAALVDLQGNTILETIDIITESTGLSPNYTYTNPLEFTTSEIEADPGTYLLAIIVQEDGTSGWYYCGSYYYKNPVYITVKEQGLAPDIYETNNEVSQSYTLPVNFSGNTANIKTTGSNCHQGSDYDYYKINLPSGSDYKVSARLHDAYNSNDGKTYTLDALFSYSLNGTDWSDAYDDIRPGQFDVTDGGNVYFLASPFFTGETGTYILEINVEKLESKPDLVISSEKVTPLTVEQGQSINASCIVFNQGQGQATYSVVKFYLSSDQNWSSSDIDLGLENVGIIIKDLGRGVDKELVIPTTATTGNQYIIFKADATETNTESNEFNNYAAVQINITPSTSIESFDQKNISIFPNPNSGIFNLYLDEKISENAIVTITDISGKTILVLKNEQLSNTNSIDLSKESKGIYFVNLVSDEQVMVKKIIVQ
jgi:hypothetical protein